MFPKYVRHTLRSLIVSFALTLFLSAFAASGFAQTVSSVAPVPSRLTQAIDATQVVTLQGTVHRLANAANDRGAAEDAMPLDRIQVVLQRSSAQEAALKQMIVDMHTPGTAMYHKWLTPTQFGQQFGPSDADIATLTSWLAAQGFTVTKVNAGKQTLEMSGTAGQFRNTFHAQIHKYVVNGQTHYANATNPQIPAALAPVFGGFASLNNFQLKSNVKVLGEAQFNAKTHQATPDWTEGTNGVNLILAPGDFAVQYDLNPLYTAGTNGTGQTIAIINESNINIALVNQYRSLFGLPANPPTVIIDGNDPGINGVNNPDGPNGASVEAYLDVEQSGAIAPAANIDLVIAGDTALTSGLSLAAEHAVYGDVAPVLSISFGGCEADQGAGGNAFWNEIWEQAAAQGQTVMVSSGDSGSAGCDDDDIQQYAVDGQAVNGIASTPYDVAVGGTDFYYSSYNGTSAAQDQQLATYWNLTPSNQAPTVSLLQVIPEQPWNDSQYGLDLFNQYADGYGTSIAAGSGGASNCATGAPTATSGGSGGTCVGYTKPSWQTAGTPADSVRDLPDVSLYASNGANYSYYAICAEDGDCQAAPAGGEVQITGVGGTSASAPSFAGIMALVNQKYGPQGQADFVLYPMAQQFPAAFHDVVNGTNSVPCADTAVTYDGVTLPPVDCLTVSNPVSVTDPIYGVATEGQIGTGTTPEYNAATGYDLASGLGTIDANVMVTDWANVKFTASTVTLTPSETSFTHGTAITISGAVTPGTAAGNVALMTTSAEPLNVGETTFPVSGGQYSGSVSYLPGGTYNIYGIYSGDGTNGSSTSSITSITVTPEASSTSLEILNSTGSAVSTGSTLPYGTQLLLEGVPNPLSSANAYTTPTGSVTFLSGAATIGTAKVNAIGEAELNYAPAPSSTAYSITAKYSGDNSYNASTSTATTFTIGRDTPTIFLSSATQTTSAVTASPGTTTLTVQVENEANSANQQQTGAAFVNSALAPTGVVTVTGLPSGTLTFPALQSALDPSTLFVEGVTVLQLPAETAGTYTVTVSYPGDANYAATTQQFPVTLTAPTGIATTTTVSASVTTTINSTAEAVTATVTGTTAGGFPSGTLTFLSSGYELGGINLPTSGTGDSVTETVNLDGSLFQGSNVITVQYSGNTVYAPSSGTATIINGGGAVSAGFTLSNTAPITIAAPGDSGTSTLTVTPVGGFTGTVALSCAVTPTTGTGVPTCAVTPVGSGTSLTYALTVNTMSTTAAGSYAVTVTGTALGATTQMQEVSVTVDAVPSIALSNSGAITIASAGGSGTSTITVTPGDGFTGSVALSCAVTPANGSDAPSCSVSTPAAITGAAAVTATLTVTTTATTASGSYTVTVTGMATGVTTQTTTVPVMVNMAPSIALSNSGAITIAAAGGSSTSTITVTPAGGFTGSVALSCAVAPATGTDAPTCSVSAPSAITGATAVTATLTVTTTGSSAALAFPKFPKMHLLPMGGGVAMATLLFFLVPVRRRRWSTLLGAMVLMVAVGFSAGCGGGSASVTPPANSGTPGGTYTVTVTGTSAGVTSQTTAVTVTVD